MAEDSTGEVTTAVDLLMEQLMPIEGELAADPLFRNIERHVPGLMIARAGGAIAFTAEGLLQGLPFFLRSRRGEATLQVGEEPTERPLYQASMEFHAMGETVTGEEFTELMLSLVPLLQRAPFLFSFNGRAVRIAGHEGALEILPEDADEVFQAWGHTAEDAYASIARPSRHLEEAGLSVTLQEKIFSLQEVDPRPLFEDDRTYPSPEPIFTVEA